MWVKMRFYTGGSSVSSIQTLLPPSKLGKELEPNDRDLSDENGTCRRGEDDSSGTFAMATSKASKLERPSECAGKGEGA